MSKLRLFPLLQAYMGMQPLWNKKRNLSYLDESGEATKRKKNRGYQRGRDNIGGDKEGEKSMK